MAKGQGQGVVLGYLRYILGFDSLAFQEGVGDADKRLKAAQKSMAKTGEKFRSIGTDLTAGITAPVLGIAAATLKMAGDFEASMNEVGISTKATSKELAEMKELALDIGKNTTKSASESAKAMDMLAKAGLNTRQILDGAARATVALAEAAGSDLDPAASAITDTMAQFKKTTADLPAIINNITGAVNESKFSFSDFQLGMGSAGGVAASSGVQFEEFTAALAGTASMFNSGEDAGTSFKTFLTTMVPKSKSAAMAMQQYGLEFFDAQGKMKALGDIAEMLRTKLIGLSDKDRNEVLSSIFGTDAMRTAVGLMNLGAKGFEDMQARIAKTDASTQAAQRMQGFNAEMEKLGGAFETLAIKVADSGMIEAITSLVAKFGELVDWLSETSPETLKWATAIAAVAAVLGPLVLGIGTMVSGLGMLLPVLTPVIAAIGTLASVIMAGVIPAIGSMLVALSPILLPIAAVAAAVAGVYLAWKNWDTIGPILHRLYSSVKKWLVDALAGVWKSIMGRIQDVADKFKWLWDVVVGHSYVPDLVDGVATEFARLDSVMVDPTTKATQTAADRFKAMQTRISGILAELFPATKAYREELEKLALIEADTTLAPAVKDAAVMKQRFRVSDAQREANQETAIPDVVPIAGALDEAWATVARAGETAAKNIQAANEVAGQSFVDMANKSLNALSNLAQSIKGGGILDILSSAFNAFGQIAQSGILGKGLAGSFANFTAISGFRANGGPVTGGKSYVVGERGPEMFTPSRSGYVHANGANDNGGHGGNVRIEVVEGALFRPVVTQIAGGVSAQTVASAAPSISGGTQKAIGRENSRRLA